MITLPEYNYTLRSFINTLLIKFKNIAVIYDNNNSALYNTPIPTSEEQHGGGYVPTQYFLQHSQYYKNMLGIKYMAPGPFDVNVVKIKDPYNPPGTIQFTKDVVSDKTGFVYTLYNKPDNLNNIMASNLSSELYIRGCMYALDKYTLYDVTEGVRETDIDQQEDGTIIGYDTKFLEELELDIIYDLQDFIYNYIKRWYVIRYSVVDSLYFHGFYASLMAALYQKLYMLKVHNINSNKIDDYNLNLFFQNHYRTEDVVQSLSNKSKRWLYVNLPSIRISKGTANTLNNIIKNVVDDNNVTTDVVSIKPHIRINENNKPVVNTFLQATDDKKRHTLDKNTFIYKEFAEGFQDRNLDNIKDKVISQLDNGFNKESPSKSMYIFNKNVFDINFKKNYRTIVNYWAWIVYGGDITLPSGFTYDIINPFNSTRYHLTLKQGFLLLLKTMLIITGDVNKNIKTIRITNILKKSGIPDHPLDDPDIGQKLLETGYATTVTDLVNYIRNIMPSTAVYYPGNISNTAEISALINSIFTFNSNFWKTANSLDNNILYGNTLKLYNMIHKYMDFDISTVTGGETIDQILRNEGTPEYPLGINTGLDYVKELVQTFLGISADSISDVSDIQQIMKEILDKLTGYTTQTILEDRGTASLQADFTQFIKSKNVLRLLIDNNREGGAFAGKTTYLPYASSPNDIAANAISTYNVTKYVPPTSTAFNEVDSTTGTSYTIQAKPITPSGAENIVVEEVPAITAVSVS